MQPLYISTPYLYIHGSLPPSNVAAAGRRPNSCRPRWASWTLDLQNNDLTLQCELIYLGFTLVKWRDCIKWGAHGWGNHWTETAAGGEGQENHYPAPTILHSFWILEEAWRYCFLEHVQHANNKRFVSSCRVRGIPICNLKSITLSDALCET